MPDPLDLMKKGAFLQKKEDLRAACLKIDRLLQNIQVSTFRFHDEDLDSIKEYAVLQAAQELVKIMPEARRLQKELDDQ